MDALEFRDAARFGLAAGTAAALGSAVAMLPDELLPEFLYESWTMPLREELRMLRVRVLERAAESCERSSETDRAERLWQRLLGVEPASEVAYQGLIRSAVRRGDRSGAERLLAACRETLQRELDVEPDASTVAMVKTGLAGKSQAVSMVESVEGWRREEPVARSDEESEIKSVRVAGSLPLAVLYSWGARVTAVVVLVALTVLFVAATPPGRSVQRATRLSVRYAISAITGQPVDPMLVVLSGIRRLSSRAHRRRRQSQRAGDVCRRRGPVCSAGRRVATGSDVRGWRCPQDGRTAAISRVVSSGVPSDQGVLDIGPLPAPDVTITELEDVAGLNSFAVVGFDDDAYLAGVVRAVTVGAATDNERVGMLDAFIASLYDPNGIDSRTPRETVALGSGRASDLNDTMAALSRVAGYRARLVDVGDPEHPGLTYPLVEVEFDGTWHVYDPATATKFVTGDGRVPSFAEVRRVPGAVRLGGAGSRGVLERGVAPKVVRVAAASIPRGGGQGGDHRVELSVWRLRVFASPLRLCEIASRSCVSCRDAENSQRRKDAEARAPIASATASSSPISSPRASAAAHRSSPVLRAIVRAAPRASSARTSTAAVRSRPAYRFVAAAYEHQSRPRPPEQRQRLRNPLHRVQARGLVAERLRHLDHSTQLRRAFLALAPRVGDPPHDVRGIRERLRIVELLPRAPPLPPRAARPRRSRRSRQAPPRANTD